MVALIGGELVTRLKSVGSIEMGGGWWLEFHGDCAGMVWQFWAIGWLVGSGMNLAGLIISGGVWWLSVHGECSLTLGLQSNGYIMEDGG